jgi:hypothetical protein
MTLRWNGTFSLDRSVSTSALVKMAPLRHPGSLSAFYGSTPRPRMMGLPGMSSCNRA